MFLPQLHSTSRTSGLRFVTVTMIRSMICTREILYTVMSKLRDKANKWLQLRSIWLWSNEQSSIGECRRFLWFLVKKSPAAAVVRYREVEKRGISKRSMSSLQLPCCLELPWCSVSKDQIGFPSPSFSSRFFHKWRQKLYLQFVLLIADFFHDNPLRVQEMG